MNAKDTRTPQQERPRARKVYVRADRDSAELAEELIAALFVIALSGSASASHGEQERSADLEHG